MLDKGVETKRSAPLSSNSQGEGETKPLRPKPTSSRKRDPRVNMSALEALVTAFGPREAARQAGMNPSTVKVIAWRHGWHHANPSPSKPGRKWKPPVTATLEPASQIPAGAIQLPSHSQPKTEESTGQPICSLSAGKALSAALERLKSESSFNLATYSAKASAEALKESKPLSISRKVKDVADIHKTIWPAENDQKQILNIGFIITGR
jgi:hypothetical protein